MSLHEREGVYLRGSTEDRWWERSIVLWLVCLFFKMHSNSSISISFKKRFLSFPPLVPDAISSVHPDLQLLSYLLSLGLPIICDFWTLILKIKHISLTLIICSQPSLSYSPSTLLLFFLLLMMLRHWQSNICPSSSQSEINLYTFSTSDDADDMNHPTTCSLDPIPSTLLQTISINLVLYMTTVHLNH